MIHVRRRIGLGERHGAAAATAGCGSTTAAAVATTKETTEATEEEEHTEIHADDQLVACEEGLYLILGNLPMNTLPQGRK